MSNGETQGFEVPAVYTQLPKNSVRLRACYEDLCYDRETDWSSSMRRYFQHVLFPLPVRVIQSVIGFVASPLVGFKFGFRAWLLTFTMPVTTALGLVFFLLIALSGRLGCRLSKLNVAQSINAAARRHKVKAMPVREEEISDGLLECLREHIQKAQEKGYQYG